MFQITGTVVIVETGEVNDVVGNIDEVLYNIERNIAFAIVAFNRIIMLSDVVERGDNMKLTYSYIDNNTKYMSVDLNRHSVN